MFFICFVFPAVCRFLQQCKIYRRRYTGGIRHLPFFANGNFNNRSDGDRLCNKIVSVVDFRIFLGILYLCAFGMLCYNFADSIGITAHTQYQVGHKFNIFFCLSAYIIIILKLMFQINNDRICMIVIIYILGVNQTNTVFKKV